VLNPKPVSVIRSPEHTSSPAKYNHRAGSTSFIDNLPWAKGIALINRETLCGNNRKKIGPGF
jgi:hypothetical protein